MQPDGTLITVSANDLSIVQYVGGSSAGTDQLTVNVFDATINEWVGAASLSAITAVPTLTANSFTVAVNQSIAAASFFTVSKCGSDNITKYQFEDTGGGSGHFAVNGTSQPDGTLSHGPCQQRG